MEHYRTLGIAYGVPSESAVEEAYHEAVKQWHPDLFENYASLRADAEEHFKLIQIAYRELKEHEANPGGLPVESASATAEDTAPFTSSFSQPISQPVSSSFSQPISQPDSLSNAQPISEPTSSPISFGDAPGCQTAPHFTELVEEISSTATWEGSARLWLSSTWAALARAPAATLNFFSWPPAES
jgi:hypothetical protein